MRYTGLNPNGINQVASGSVAVLVENTRVATFGTNTLSVTGSTILSGSVAVTGPQINNGNLTVTGSTILSGSLSTIGPITSSGTFSLVSGSSGVNIGQSLTHTNSTSSYIYGLNLTPTLTNTAPSQTQTAFRVNATFTGSYTGSDTSNIIADFGASSVGSQLTITDVTSGSIYMVNDVSGLPIIEALSDWTVKMYNYPNVVFEKTGSALYLGVSNNTSSLVTVQASSSFTSPATFGSDIIVNQGYGFTYKQTQTSGSTLAASTPTASLYTLALNQSSSVSLIALITGYGTGSQDSFTGEIRSTVKRVGTGSAAVVGENIRFITADFSGSDADIIVSGSNAILVVTGSTAEPYAWRATITTQIV